MIANDTAASVLAEIQASLPTLAGRDAALQAAMQIIARRLPHYNWVGVYLLDVGVLNLGPYVGAATDHTLIPVGKGVCGTAVAENRNRVVPDVREVENYLSCSLETRAEIVVLIREAGTERILGQIDADSDTVGAFDATDEAFLSQVADLLAPRMWTAD